MLNLLILLIVALVLCSVGFKRYVWFISIGYGFAIAGIGIAIVTLYQANLSLLQLVLCIALIVYGARLSGYIILREARNSTYRAVLKSAEKDGDSVGFGMKFFLWIACGLLYVLMASPVFFRVLNQSADSVWGWIGLLVMIAGMALEAFADYTKSSFKKSNPHRFCDIGVFKPVRCPNYFGEMLIWLGVFLSGFGALHGLLQWILAIAGFVCIIFVMFSGARRLELRQKENYGSDPEFQAYIQKTPLLIPLVPLYSLEKYSWLRW